MPNLGKASDWSAGAADRLSGLKDKIGFGRKKKNPEEQYDEYGYDEYGEYEGAAYGEESYNAYEDMYGEYAYNPDEDAKSSMVSSRGRSHPNLVSIDDVRARTSISDRSRRDSSSAEPEHFRSSVSEAVASTNTEPLYNSRSVSGESSTHTRGYSSLFGTDADEALEEQSGLSGVSGAGQVTASYRPSDTTDYDPYATYEGAGAATHTPTRSLKVLEPQSYGEVESVARALKLGDAVVLSLTETPSDLSKRILDFSFGVASALDARVDCVAEKVFVIARGNELSPAETLRLKEEGILS